MALADNLVSYWKLDEASGNAADSVGSNTLTNTNVTYATGKINNGALFNSSSDILSIANATQSGLSITGDITVQAWIKMTSLPANENSMVIIEKGIGTGNTENYSLRLQQYPSGTHKIQFFTYSTALDFHGVNYNVTLNTDGTWYHIIGRRDSTTWKIFVNGIEQASSTDSQAPIASDAAVNVGCRGSGVQSLDGMIDELGVWSSALSSTEITALYNSGAGLAYPFSSSTAIKHLLASTGVGS